MRADNERARPEAAHPGTGQEQDAAAAHPQRTPIHEPSGWLRGRVAQRAARARLFGLDPHNPDPLVIMPLGRPGVPGEPSDRECDRCEVYVPESDRLWLSQLHALPGLLLVGALCGRCVAAEGVER